MLDALQCTEQFSRKKWMILHPTFLLNFSHSWSFLSLEFNATIFTNSKWVFVLLYKNFPGMCLLCKSRNAMFSIVLFKIIRIFFIISENDIITGYAVLGLWTASIKCWPALSAFTFIAWLTNGVKMWSLVTVFQCLLAGKDMDRKCTIFKINYFPFIHVWH